MRTSDLTFSKIITYILHPMLIPTYIIIFLMFRPELYLILIPAALKIWFVSIVILFTLVIPVTGIYLLVRFNALSAFEMTNHNERTLPLLMTVCSYIALLFTMKSVNIPPIFIYMLYIATLALLTGLMINLVYKISLHTLGWSALTATLISLSIKTGFPLLLLSILSILLSGLVGYARLKENAHNETQIYTGYVAGVSIIILLSILS